MKNTLTIKIEEQCSCECLDSVFDGSNSIFVSVDVPNETNPRLIVYKDGIPSTTTLKPQQLNNVEIAMGDFTSLISGQLTFQYISDDRTGSTFTITFPEKVEGNMMLKRVDDHTYKAQFTEYGSARGSEYELQPATTTTLGGVIVGENIEVETDGTISAPKITELEEDMYNLFTSVSNGKKEIALAITDKGVSTEYDATFSEMAENISKIPTGGSGSDEDYVIGNDKYNNAEKEVAYLEDVELTIVKNFKTTNSITPFTIVEFSDFLEMPYYKDCPAFTGLGSYSWYLLSKNADFANGIILRKDGNQIGIYCLDELTNNDGYSGFSLISNGYSAFASDLKQYLKVKSSDGSVAYCGMYYYYSDLTEEENKPTTKQIKICICKVKNLITNEDEWAYLIPSTSSNEISQMCGGTSNQIISFCGIVDSSSDLLVNTSELDNLGNEVNLLGIHKFASSKLGVKFNNIYNINLKRLYGKHRNAFNLNDDVYLTVNYSRKTYGELLFKQIRE